MTLVSSKDVYVHIFDRSNPFEVIGWSSTEQRDFTRLDELQLGRCLRNDIAMICITSTDYCVHCHRGSQDEEILLYANSKGEVMSENPAHFEKAKLYLSHEQLDQLYQIAREINQAALVYPEMRQMLHS